MVINFDLPPIDDTEEIKKKIAPLKELYEKALKENHSTNFKKIHEFGIKLDRKHTNARKYRLFLLLTMGTPWAKCPYYDFEGDDSIEKFIKSL